MAERDWDYSAVQSRSVIQQTATLTIVKPHGVLNQSHSQVSLYPMQLLWFEVGTRETVLPVDVDACGYVRAILKDIETLLCN